MWLFLFIMLYFISNHLSFYSIKALNYYQNFIYRLPLNFMQNDLKKELKGKKKFGLSKFIKKGIKLIKTDLSSSSSVVKEIQIGSPSSPKHLISGTGSDYLSELKTIPINIYQQQIYKEGRSV